MGRTCMNALTLFTAMMRDTASWPLTLFTVMMRDTASHGGQVQIRNHYTLALMPPCGMLILSRKLSEQERWLPRPWRWRGTSSCWPWGQWESPCHLPLKTGGTIAMHWRRSCLEAIFPHMWRCVNRHWFKSNLKACALCKLWACAIVPINDLIALEKCI